MIYERIYIEDGEYVHEREGVEIERRPATDRELTPPDEPSADAAQEG